MNTDEKLKLLEQWQVRYNAADFAWDKFSALTRADVDSELGNAIYQMFDAYTKSVGVLVGDHANWLGWWIYENKQGNKHWSTPYPVKIGKRKFKARTLRHLLKIIEAHA